MIVQIACDPGKFERAFHHAQRSVAVTIQDAIRKRAVIRSDAHCYPAFFAKIDQRRKTLPNPRQLRPVLLVGILADDELL